MGETKREDVMTSIIDSFNSVIGYEDVKNELYEYCDILRDPEKYNKKGIYSPHGIIFYGNPGVGKSLISSCIVKASNRTSFVIRRNKTRREFVGYIKEVFDQAKENAPSIIILDDLDKFANDGYDHKNSEEYVAVQSCIDEVKDSEVFVIATVNDMDMLPDSLTRSGRFDRILHIQKPDNDDALNIIRYHLNKKSELSELDIDELAGIMSGTSCAMLESVINEAGIMAVHSNKDHIEREDVIKAYLRIAFKASESTCNGNNDERLYRVIHEAGHTLVSELLDPGSVKIVSVEKHIGSVGGVTSTNMSDKCKLSNERLERHLLILMAGRAATEVVTGKADIGASSDMSRAREAIDSMHKEYAPKDFITLGSGHYRDSEGVEDIRAKYVANDMDRFYKESRKMIIENRRYLDEIISMLLENTTLTQRELKKVMECN